MKSRPTTKNDIRKRRHARIRARVVGSPERPRLTVFKSNKFISVQVVDDAAGRTLAAAHGREFSAKGGSASGGKISVGAQAAKVGEAIAERAKAAGISAVVFDRGGYQYAAQIRALADAARAGGLTF